MTVRAVFVDADSQAAPTADFSACSAPEFEVRVAGSPDEARTRMAAGDVDVLVARLTDSDGIFVDLLADVAINYPQIGRLAITDPSSDGVATMADQRLVHPFDADQLRVHLLTTLHLRDRVPVETLLKLTEGSVKLPTLPDVYLRIQGLLRSENASITKIGEVIREDPAISIKVLQIVNSSLYGLRTEVGDIPHAASMLGINTLTALVLAVGVFKQSDGLDRRYIETLWRGSVATSALARKIAIAEGLSRTEVESTQLAGLLHDIGDLVLIRNWRDQFTRVRPEHRQEDELALFGTTHADLGGYLCALWGLPSPVIAAVANHHHPHRCDLDRMGPTTVVHVARAVVAAGMNPYAAVVERDHLERIGHAGRLEEWAALAD